MASKMASYVTGYEDERFEQVVSQSFHCIICTNVFRDPVMCRHNEHLFCRACITIHLRNSQTCPTCMEPLTVDTLTQAPRGIRNILSELKILCEFYERGCMKYVELGDLERHVADCGFAPAVCSNEGCELEMNKQDLIRHETAVCELRRVECRSCGKLRQELAAVKVTLASLNKKLEKNEQNMSKNVQKMSKNVQKIEANLGAVERKFQQQEVCNREFQGQIVEMKKRDEITEQLGRMTQRPSCNKAEQKEIVKKGIARSRVMNREPKIVVAGGHNDEGKDLNSVEVLSLSTQTWRRLQPMKECRSGASSVVHNNKVVVTGGMRSSDSDDLAMSLERLSTNAVHAHHSVTWEKRATMLGGCLRLHSSVVHDGQLIMIGGIQQCSVVRHGQFIFYGSDQIRVIDGAFVFFLVSILGLILPGFLGSILGGLVFAGFCAISLWVIFSGFLESVSENIIAVSPDTTNLLATMPQGLGRCQHGVAIFGDKIVIVGGCKMTPRIFPVIFSSVVMYDISENKFQELAPLPYPLYGMATVKWDDDNVIIIGGAGSDEKPSNKVLMYNIRTQESRELPDMKYKREGCVAAVVRDTVIVMGGRDGGRNVLKSVESFRFDRYSWEELPEMHDARRFATAVVC